jgi:hypothetical protein
MAKHVTGVTRKMFAWIMVRLSQHDRGCPCACTRRRIAANIAKLPELLRVAANVAKLPALLKRPQY